MNADGRSVAVAEAPARELPAGWRWARLGEVCELNPVRRSDRPLAPDAEVSFVPMAAVDERAGEIRERLVRPFVDVRKGYTYFEEGDVLFAKITPCMQNGKHAIAEGLVGGIGFGTTEFHVIRPSPAILAQWIHLFIRQPAVLQRATGYFTGSVGQQRVPDSFLRDLEIPLPPVEEQRRIVGILKVQLGAVERARAACEAQLEAARALRLAYLREVYDTADASGWQRYALSEIAEIQLGKMLSPKSKTGLSSLPYLRNANVQWGSFDLSDIAEMDFSEAEVAKFELRASDLLVCEGGEPGRAAVWQMELPRCYYQMALHRIRPLQNQLDPYFLMYRLWFGSLRGEFTESHAKTTIAHLPAIRLEKLAIAMPGIAEQRLLVGTLRARFSGIDRIFEVIRAKAALIEQAENAILRKAFSGEL